MARLCDPRPQQDPWRPHVCAVKAPGYGDRRKRILEDIAVLTGGQAALDELGVKVADITADMLGTAKSVTISKDNTVVVGGAGSKEAIDARIAQIKGEMENTTSDFDREKLQERLAKLSGGVAVIKVGAATESELKEIKHRVEDALQATRAAVEEGIVAGGGVASWTLLLRSTLLSSTTPRRRSASTSSRSSDRSGRYHCQERWL